MKKIRIPRRDHEVYFIPVPETLKSKRTGPFIFGQMEKLHPGFSGENALDIKRLVFNKTRWVMATVMEAETLEEYRILNKGCAFFTNTSIAVYKKDFAACGVKTVGDELIGFDSDYPVSIPLESGPPDSGKTGNAEDLAKAVKTAPARCRVFTGRIPALRVTAMIACAVLLSLIPLFFFPAAKEAKEPAIVSFDIAKATPSPESKYTPAAMEILADFSEDLFLAGGVMTRWQYSEGSGPFVVIETRGIDILSLRNIFNQYRYVVLEDMHDVRYIDGEPYLTVFLSVLRKGYALPPAGTFFSQSFSLPIFSDLMGEFKHREISVVSETLPSTENDNAIYTVTYTAKDSALISSLEIITGICDKYPVRVKAMDVSIAGEGNYFAVLCSLSQSDAPRNTAYGLGDEKERIHLAIIPTAFGYKEAPPLLPPPMEVTVQLQEPIAPQIPLEPQAREITPEVSVLGTIRDDRGQILFYREAGDNKIIIKDTPKSNF